VNICGSLLVVALQIFPFNVLLSVKAFRQQIDFSEKLGIENSHLSRLESGIREPKLTMLRTLADALGVSISELMKGL
jgi:transcriptional regulator with XRE-family HTH domain